MPARSRRPAQTDPSGSWSRIHAVVRRIPAGRVATYGQVAALAGLPGHARLAGYALAGLPDGTPLPWHRVINAAGRVSARHDGPGGTVLQRLRLEKEGVVFDARGRVDFGTFGWRPRGSESLTRRRGARGD